MTDQTQQLNLTYRRCVRLVADVRIHIVLRYNRFTALARGDHTSAPAGRLRVSPVARAHTDVDSDVRLLLLSQSGGYKRHRRSLI